jgi:Na+/proline symporter
MNGGQSEGEKMSNTARVVVVLVVVLAVVAAYVAPNAATLTFGTFAPVGGLLVFGPRK